MDSIDFLVKLGIFAIVIVAVVAIINYFGIVIPKPVYIVLSAIAGILLLVWGARFLQTAF